jgi:diamine N-acetyltransferase
MLRPATPADISHIAALERLPEYRLFVGQWSEERHLATMTGADARYFVAEGENRDLEAFAILRGFAEPNNAIELKRIVVRSPQRGLGRRMMEDLMRMVFAEFKAHRLFLDVFETNTRARHLYESLGFIYEGTLRDAACVDGDYFSLCLMSMLDREYFARKPSSN